MLRPDYRSAYVIAVVTGLGLAVGLTVAAPASAQQASSENEAKDVKASMQCDRASEPGRVRCSVEARIEGGRTIAWADVEILSLPDFASALKGRIGPQDAVARDATSAKWGLGLVAQRAERRRDRAAALALRPGDGRGEGAGHGQRVIAGSPARRFLGGSSGCW
jgi:hypothetical protein